MMYSPAEKRPNAPARWSRPGAAVVRGAEPAAAPAEARRRIDQTVGYMRQCLGQTVQVPTLARMASLSLSHFFALFKRQTGFAPMDYFIRLRMQRACELLDATTLSVKEIAGKLGYEDPFYFSRVFKCVNGMAPTEYRRLEAGSRRVLRTLVLPATAPGSSALRPARSETASRL
jgi:transcriptional regulator GlxA family with amidase domain